MAKPKVTKVCAACGQEFNPAPTPDRNIYCQPSIWPEMAPTKWFCSDECYANGNPQTPHGGRRG